jgi:hypothetical protein
LGIAFFIGVVTQLDWGWVWLEPARRFAVDCDSFMD